MSIDPIENLLQRWHQDNLQQLDDAVRPCKRGPSLAALYLHVTEGAELVGEQARHVNSCASCSRLRERIESQVKTAASADVRPSEIPIDPLVETVSARPATEHALSRIRLALRRSRRRWVMRGSLVAACALITLLYFWLSAGGRSAHAQDLREFGFSPPLAMIGLWPDLTDEAAIRAAQQRVANARVKLEQAMSGQLPGVAPWIPWTQLYRNLRALGKWDESHEELQKFLAYAEEQDRSPDRFTMYYAGLYDLGNYHTALGDYEKAIDLYHKSLRLKREYQEWYHRPGQANDHRPHALEAALAISLTPPLWQLSTLAAAQGNQPKAWEYHHQAGELLVDYLRKECAYRNMTVAPAPRGRRDQNRNREEAVSREGEAPAEPQSEPRRTDQPQHSDQNRDRKRADEVAADHSADLARAPDAIRAPTASEGNPPDAPSIYDMALALAALNDRALQSPIVHARQHLLHEAALTRLDRKPDAAAEILQQAGNLADIVRADDFRQDFNIPMEALRIAIARGNFPAALAAADEAAQNTGPRTRETPDQPPIGPIAKAELRFLHGVALLGQHIPSPSQGEGRGEGRPSSLKPQASEGLRLIQEALAVPQQMAEQMDEATAETFMKRFESWQSLAVQIGAKMEPRDLRRGE